MDSDSDEVIDDEELKKFFEPDKAYESSSDGSFKTEDEDRVIAVGNIIELHDDHFCERS